MASFMVKLHCESVAEKILIPAFVYFFFKLYPPAWIANPRRPEAGAAGGMHSHTSRGVGQRPAALKPFGKKSSMTAHSLQGSSATVGAYGLAPLPPHAAFVPMEVFPDWTHDLAQRV